MQVKQDRLDIQVRTLPTFVEPVMVVFILMVFAVVALKPEDVRNKRSIWQLIAQGGIHSLLKRLLARLLECIGVL